MERVVEELKKIDDQAAQIRVDAAQKADELVEFARGKALKLVDGAEKDAQETVKKMWKNFDEGVNRKQSEAKLLTESRVQDLRKLAEKRFDAAVDLVFRKAVGES